MASLFAALGLAVLGMGQQTQSVPSESFYTKNPFIIYPASSRRSAFAHRYHTNFLVNALSVAQHQSVPLAPSIGPFFQAGGYGPSSLWAAYGLTSVEPNVGSGVIAIVDAFHDPTALHDFNVFSAQYGLPQETSTNPTAASNQHFQVVYQGGTAPTTPPSEVGWIGEISLDIEWAHAMAPNAKIILYEAQDNFDNLYVMAQQAAQNGANEVSMSFGGGEFSGEAALNSYFQHAGTSYFASTGDSGSAPSGDREIPSLLDSVVGVGGTSLQFVGGNAVETGWSDAGGGISAYIARPSFQSSVQSIVGAFRGAPDVSAVADPYTGVNIYTSTDDGYGTGWQVFGGTSLACPVVAAITNVRGNWSSTVGGELSRIYNFFYTQSRYPLYYRDVTSGLTTAGSCKSGYDLVTGIGTPVGLVNWNITYPATAVSSYYSGSSTSGGLTDIGSLDGSSMTTTSIRQGYNQTAGDVVTVTNAGLTSATRILGYSVTFQLPTTAYLQLFGYNYATGAWDRFATQRGNGASQNLSYYILTSQVPNYISGGTSKFLLRGYAPGTYSTPASPFTLGVDLARCVGS